MVEKAQKDRALLWCKLEEVDETYPTQANMEERQDALMIEQTLCKLIESIMTYM